MNCTNCGAPMRLVHHRDYFVCDYCTTFHFPKESDEGVRVLGEKTEVHCPVCRHELVSGAIESHLVKTCPNCKGILARRRAFGIIVEKRRAKWEGAKPYPKPIHDDERARTLECPGCRASMDNHPYLGPGAVMVDSCGECALIWLDRGEMTIIERS
ncbi:MAG: zf-TFIIB domain-containing protein [bacterium]